MKVLGEIALGGIAALGVAAICATLADACDRHLAVSDCESSGFAWVCVQRSLPGDNGKPSSHESCSCQRFDGGAP